MVNVTNSVETLPKISIARVGRTNVTDRRRRWTDDIANVNVSRVWARAELEQVAIKASA